MYNSCSLNTCELLQQSLWKVISVVSPSTSRGREPWSTEVTSLKCRQEVCKTQLKALSWVGSPLQSEKASQFFTPFSFSAYVNLSSVLYPRKHSFDPRDSSGTTQRESSPKTGNLLRRGRWTEVRSGSWGCSDPASEPASRAGKSLCARPQGSVTPCLNTATCSGLLCPSSAFGGGLRAQALKRRVLLGPSAWGPFKAVWTAEFCEVPQSTHTRSFPCR